MHDSSRLHQRYVFLAVLLGLVVSLSAQTANTGSVAVGGDVLKPFTLTLAELKSMPRTTIKLGNPQRPAVYEGVLLAEVLKRAGASIGPELSGPAVASYVLATATDGYRALFIVRRDEAHRTLAIAERLTVEFLIESVITRRSAEELELRKGDRVSAVVKATEVMIAK